MGNTEEKIVDLEVKLGFLERTVEQLNEALVEQDTVIQRMDRRLQQLTERLAKASDTEEGERDPLDERPPHY